MNRIDRLFGILTFLQSRKYTTTEKIAEKFNISVRTVYRDVKALGEQGIPVSFEANRGYFIVQGYFLPPVAFSAEEANALLLMESMVQGFADRSIFKHYSSALLKVKNVMRAHDKDKLEELGNNIRLQLPERLSNNFEWLSTIQVAISNKQILEIGYTNNKDETSRRRVEPIGLVFYAFSWHLIGWCHYRLDYRDFRVSRITKVLNTLDPFSKTAHIPLNDYIKQLPVNY